MKAMHPLFRKWLTIFLCVLLIGVLGGGLATGALIGYLESMPPISRLENYNPPEISRVYDRSGNTQIGQFFSKRRELVRMKEVPEHVQHAFLAIEDERFRSHFGVDVRGIFRAIVENLKSGGKSQGASTITMQVARNVVLEDLSKNIGRKFREVLLALQIERDFSKDQILEFYLNHIFFGARAYGIQAASRAYFNKDVKDLNVVEAAMLAGLPKAPSSLSPFNDKEACTDRRNLVLGNMRRLNYIKSEAEYKRLVALPIELNPPPPSKTIAPYFVDYVSNVLVTNNNLEKRNDLGQKAYQVISTVDLELQQIVQEELSKGLRAVELESRSQNESRYAQEDGGFGDIKNNPRRLARITEVGDEYIRVSVHGRSAKVPLPAKLPFFYPDKAIKEGNLVDVYVTSLNDDGSVEAYLWDKAHVQGAAVLMNNQTGEILALVGGDDRNDKANSGEWNRAFQGGSQPGSNWKPLLYAGAFDVMKDGKPEFTPATVIQDEPFSIGDWTPQNYSNKYYGATTLYKALVSSRNVPTVKLFVDVGAKKAIKIYNSFNVLTRPSDWDIPAYAPVALGTPDITPLELAGAYSVFANQGIGIHPTPLRRLFSGKSATDSRIVKPEEYKVLSPEAAFMTATILQDVVAQGTGKATVGKWILEEKEKGNILPQIGAKTGTTNDCMDAWVSGITPELTLVINVGYDRLRSLGPKMTGGKVCGPIWVNIMDRVLKTRNDWKMKFDAPAGVEFRDICSRSGQLLTAGCYASGANVFKNAAFKTGSAPESSCSYHGGGGHREPASYNPADPESQYQMQQQYQPPQYRQQYQQPYYQGGQQQGSYYGYQ